MPYLLVTACVAHHLLGDGLSLTFRCHHPCADSPVFDVLVQITLPAPSALPGASWGGSPPSQRWHESRRENEQLRR